MALKKYGQVLILPFDQYPATKDKFFVDHPKAKIIEEIKSIGIARMEVPDPHFIGKVKTQEIMSVTWAIIYTEPEQLPKA